MGSGHKAIGILLLIFCSVALSGQSIWTATEKYYSANKRYCVNVNGTGKDVYRIEMVERDSGSVLWSQWAQWSRACKGLVSDDGSAFVVLNTVYSPNNDLVVVNTKDRQEAYSVKSIPIRKEYLTLNADNYLWIDNDDKSAMFLYDAAGRVKALDLTIVDGRTLQIALR